MNRYLMLLLAGSLSIFTLSSCAAPGTGKSGAVGSADVALKDMGNGVCSQTPSGLMWQIKKSGMIATGKEAEEYVQGLHLAGFDDWRLPTSDETRFFAELVLMKKGDCPVKKSIKGYWVSNGKKAESGLWDDYPLCGGPEFRWLKSKKGYVRAVRP